MRANALQYVFSKTLNFSSLWFAADLGPELPENGADPLLSSGSAPTLSDNAVHEQLYELRVLQRGAAFIVFQVPDGTTFRASLSRKNGTARVPHGAYE